MGVNFLRRIGRSILLCPDYLFCLEYKDRHFLSTLYKLLASAVAGEYVSQKWIFARLGVLKICKTHE